MLTTTARVFRSQRLACGIQPVALPVVMALRAYSISRIQFDNR